MGYISLEKRLVLFYFWYCFEMIVDEELFDDVFICFRWFFCYFLVNSMWYFNDFKVFVNV